jgi:hypothetical protein
VAAGSPRGGQVSFHIHEHRPRDVPGQVATAAGIGVGEVPTDIEEGHRSQSLSQLRRVDEGVAHGPPLRSREIKMDAATDTKSMEVMGMNTVVFSPR